MTAGVLIVLVAITWMLRHDAGASIAAQGSIYQSGALAGWASGARIAPDRSMVEFEEISNASRLVHRHEFEFDGYLLRISKIRQVQYSDAKDIAAGQSGPALPPQATLVQVVAKIQRAR